MTSHPEPKIPDKPDPSADIYAPENSSTTFEDSVPTKLTLFLKLIKVSKECQKYITQKLEGTKFLKIKWTFYDLEQSLTTRQLQDRKLKIDSTFDYELEIDEDFMSSLEENPAVFKLYACNENQEIFINEAKFYIGTILNAVNRKLNTKIVFRTNSTVFAHLELWYKFACNEREMRILCSGFKVLKRISYLGDAEVLPSLKPAVSETDQLTTQNGDPRPELSITVAELYFLEMYKDTDRVYVEYSFLGHEGPEMETPFSVALGTFTNPSVFNFTKTFRLDVEQNYENCKLLTKMVKNNVVIKFAVIIEPVESFDCSVQICQEIGYAEVSFDEIVQLQENVDSCQYEILDFCDPRVVLGYITVKFEGILAMKKVLETLL